MAGPRSGHRATTARKRGGAPYGSESGDSEPTFELPGRSVRCPHGPGSLTIAPSSPTPSTRHTKPRQLREPQKRPHIVWRLPQPPDSGPATELPPAHSNSTAPMDKHGVADLLQLDSGETSPPSGISLHSLGGFVGLPPSSVVEAIVDDFPSQSAMKATPSDIEGGQLLLRRRAPTASIWVCLGGRALETTLSKGSGGSPSHLARVGLTKPGFGRESAPPVSSSAAVRSATNWGGSARLAPDLNVRLSFFRGGLNAPHDQMS